MNYIGEHLLPGQAGNFFIMLSLVASFAASFSYYKAVIAREIPDREAWKKLARGFFFTEVISVLGVFICLLSILYGHLFEYKYAWQHSNRALEFKYILSSFWEGQEGSTLLWTFWHCVLGCIIIARERKQEAGGWEAPVMAIISFAQFFLATMVAGIHIFDVKIGSNPFILLRESGVLDQAPAMHANFDPTQPIRADYLQLIKDGNGLNPLLQNYWMVIHPPILFLGFASTIVPFAYAMAGLLSKNISGWINRVLPWALFSVAILGLGIMMGAKWAYESLNFGGYWAWDPVENASLVPWMIMVCGLHTLLIYKHTGHSLRSTYIFFALSFLFIVYSTFLTKSGVLGDTSVHAFADIGMNGQLFLFLLVFIWLTPFCAATTNKQKLIIALSGAVLSLATYYWGGSGWGLPLYVALAGVVTFIVFLNKQVPAVKKEESASSREFWMFIGALVFFLSAMIICVQTSLPVFNKLFDLKKAAPEKDEFAYNQIQVLVAIIVGVLTAVSQYFRYKHTGKDFFLKKIILPAVISAVIAAFILLVIKINYDKEGTGFLINIWIALIAAVFAAVANGMYIFTALKGRISNSGGSIAHLGFGIVLVGILLSSGKKEILSWNTSGIAVPFARESKEKSGENLTLVKGLPMAMSDYTVTYESDSLHPKKPLTFFKVHFISKDKKEDFYLTPNAFVNFKGNNELIANPDARHYWNHDIFTYISSFYKPVPGDDTVSFKPHTLSPTDTVYYSKGYITLIKMAGRDNLPGSQFAKTDSGFTASLKVQRLNGASYTSDVLLVKSNGRNLFQTQDTVMSQNLVLQLNNVTGNKAEIGVKESDDVMEYVTLKAYKFPYINLLWLGVIITVAGALISMAHRMRLNKRATTNI